MNWMQMIGGRKFLMALICVGVATFVELHNPQSGLSPTLASFLGVVLAAFSATNYMATAKHMDSKPGGGASSQTETILRAIKDANNPEQVSQVVEILQNTLSTVKELENVSRQQGTLMLNLGNKVQEMSKKLG